MPAPAPPIGMLTAKALRGLGARLRARRKELKLSAVVTAEAAGMSRVTLHRIERGEPSVAMGAYVSVIGALGLELELLDPGERRRAAKKVSPRMPREVRLADYPQLQKLAWQLRGKRALTPKEAIELYERNWRHVDPAALDEHERALIEALVRGFGRERLLV